MHNYRLLEQVGTGSYSTVFRAEDLRNGRMVAVKHMKFFYSKATKLQDTELLALQLFSECPCVVRLLEHFIEQDVMVLVFELAGPTLLQVYQQLRSQQLRMHERDIRLIVYQVAVALAEVHSKGFMHRDLKPQNILLERLQSGELAVKLVDFGMCRKRPEKMDEALTGYVTTRWYRAPEVILSLPYDSKLDVFSLGAVMLELYLNYEAFPGADAIDQLNRVFSVTGTPTMANWPEGMGLLEQKKIQFPQYPPLDLAKHLPDAMPEAVDLMQKMIDCSARHRISMVETLQHPYFRDISEGLPKGVKQVALKLIAESATEPISAKIEHQRVQEKVQIRQQNPAQEVASPPVQIFAQKQLHNLPQDALLDHQTTARKKKMSESTPEKLVRTRSKKSDSEDQLGQDMSELMLMS